MMRNEIPTALKLGGEHIVQITTKRGGRKYEIPYLSPAPTVPSVTSIIDRTLRNFGLEKWRMDWIERGLQGHVGEALTEEFISDILRASQDEADASASIGIAAHSMIQAVLAGVDLDTYLDDPALDSILQGFLRWRKATMWTHIGSELGVYNFQPSEGIGYAGQVDALFADPATGDLIVVDWKTGGIYDSAAMQGAAYAMALRHMLEEEAISTVAHNGGGKTTHQANRAVHAMIVRFVGDHPKVDGVKDRMSPKVFSPEVEYVWVDIDMWWPNFVHAASLTQRPRISTSRLLEEGGV